MADPDQDIVNLIDAAFPSLTKGTNLFMGKVQAAIGSIPARAVFVLASGGPAPEAFIGSTVERRYSAVQIRVRVEQQAFGSGQALARSLLLTVHHCTLIGYIDVRVNETEPIYIGEDDDGQHEWSFNAELWHES